VPQRLKQLNNDPWADIGHMHQRLPAAATKV